MGGAEEPYWAGEARARELLEIAESVEADTREAKRLLRLAASEAKRFYFAKARERLGAIDASLGPALRERFSSALDALARKIEDAKAAGLLVSRAALLEESARTAAGLGDFFKARDETRACIAEIRTAVARAEKVEAAREAQRVLEEAEAAVGAARKFGFQVDEAEAALAQGRALQASGDLAGAAARLRDSVSIAEKALEKVTPRLRAVMGYDSSAIREGRRAKVRVVIKNESRAPAKDVRALFEGPLECDPIEVGMLKGGISHTAEVEVKFIGAGEAVVRLHTLYRRTFDDREFEHVAEGKLTVRPAGDPLAGRSGAPERIASH